MGQGQESVPNSTWESEGSSVSQDIVAEVSVTFDSCTSVIWGAVVSEVSDSTQVGSAESELVVEPRVPSFPLPEESPAVWPVPSLSL